MRRGGGKQKGAGYEREVCRTLSRFIVPETDDTLFWRSAMSGGRATLQGKINTTQLGDLTCIHPAGQWLTDMFVIECKFYRDLSIASSLLFGRGNLAKFWQQACRQAWKHERSPLLVAKQNLTPPLVLFDEDGLRRFRALGHEAQVLLITDAITRRPTKAGGSAVVCSFAGTFGST